MKEIPYVADIHMEAPNEEPYYRIPGVADGFTQNATRRVPKPDGSIGDEPNAPWMVRQIAFLLERVADAKFVEGMDAIDGELLRDDVRGVIKRQRELAPKRGCWRLENDDHANRIMQATVKPAAPMQPAALTFNCVPFIRAVKAMTTPAEASEPVAVSNGSAQAS
jgi:hypothetical protein